MPCFYVRLAISASLASIVQNLFSIFFYMCKHAHSSTAPCQEQVRIPRLLLVGTHITFKYIDVREPPGGGLGTGGRR